MRPIEGRRILSAASALALAVALLAGASARADSGPNPTNVGGSLIAGGELTGTVEIDFNVDPTTTYTATLAVDGTPLVNASTTKGSARLTLDTTTLLDGSHSVLATVGDGTSTTTVWNGSIATQNAPLGGVPSVSGTPTVGATLTASPGNWSPDPTGIAYQWERCTATLCAPIPGANDPTYALAAADANAELEVVIAASNSSGTTLATSAPTPAISAAGAASASSSAPCSDPQLDAQIDGHTTETVALGQGATLDGQLSCAGDPLAGATLELAIGSPGGQGSPSYATVRTAADGSFSYSLAPGPSREITLSYANSANAQQPQAVTTLALLVRPRITLSITPRATTNHHSITFAGRVLGGHIGGGGLPLQLQYREGSRWMIYTEIVANARNGRFRYRYTFERTTVSITYTFRVAIPATGVAGYPFAPAASAPRSVRVEP